MESLDFVRVPARLASKNGDVVFGVASGHAGGKVEAEEFVVKGPSISNGGGRCRAHGNDLEQADPNEVEFVFSRTVASVAFRMPRRTVTAAF